MAHPASEKTVATTVRLDAQLLDAVKLVAGGLNLTANALMVRLLERGIAEEGASVRAALAEQDKAIAAALAKRRESRAGQLASAVASLAVDDGIAAKRVSRAKAGAKARTPARSKRSKAVQPRLKHSK